VTLGAYGLAAKDRAETSNTSVSAKTRATPITPLRRAPDSKPNDTLGHRASLANMRIRLVELRACYKFNSQACRKTNTFVKPLPCVLSWK
jgi:hypothetical protein